MGVHRWGTLLRRPTGAWRRCLQASVGAAPKVNLMSTNTSIGPDGKPGDNEDHGNADGCGNKTLGEKSTQQPPTGAGVQDESGVEASPGELDAGRGKLPKDC